MTVVDINNRKERVAAHQEAICRKLLDLEPLINDLSRWTKIGSLMSYRDLDESGVELLGLEVIMHVERLTTELKEAFYRATKEEDD